MKHTIANGRSASSQQDSAWDSASPLRRCPTIIVVSVPTFETGGASSVNANIRIIDGAIGAAVTASLVTSHLAANHLPRETGYVGGFLFLFGATVLATIPALIIPAAQERRNEATHPMALDSGQAAEQRSTRRRNGARPELISSGTVSEQE